MELAASNSMPVDMFNGNRDATYTAPTNMDIDMDIDMDVDIAPEDLEAAAALNQELSKTSNQPQNNLEPTHDAQLVENKVNLRGVDLLSTDDIRKYAAEHLAEYPAPRVEWIDDTSVNLVYESSDIAAMALIRLSDADHEAAVAVDRLSLRPARRFSEKPEVRLDIRASISTDVKQRGARERSRYYLFNPDADPGERRRRGGRRSRDHSRDGQFRRRKFDDYEHRRRRDEDVLADFGADLYDDDDAAVAARERRARLRRDSRSSYSSEDARRGSDSRIRRRRSDQNELFPDKSGSSGRLRRRSASPVRKKDGDSQMADSSKSRFRERSYTPPSSYSEKDPQKELFPDRKPKRNPETELRGDVTPQYNRTKELFSAKFSSSVHRRSDAFDAADETADLFANRMAVPFVDGSADQRPSPRSLASRVSKAESSLSLAERMTFPKDDGKHQKPAESSDTAVGGGFSIRGAARRPDAQGILVRGQASESSGTMDLFPGKTNRGKELFSQKLEGRGGRRNRAEDMFN